MNQSYRERVEKRLSLLRDMIKGLENIINLVESQIISKEEIRGMIREYAEKGKFEDEN